MNSRAIQILATLLLLQNPLTSMAIYLPSNMFKSTPRDGEADDRLVLLLKGLPSPKQKEIDVNALLYQLGDEYDPYFTSITEPNSMKLRDVGNKKHDVTKETMQTFPKMSNLLKNMKLKKVYTKERKSKRTELGKKTSHRMKNWLWSLSKCPVFYRWVDMGEKIFPRYIKRGECSKKKTCSFPAGMKCQKKSWKSVTVLIYICRKQLNSVSLSPLSPGCRWRVMKISVLSECQCGCSPHNK